MREIVYDFEEFRARVDRGKPIHHSCWHRLVDKYGARQKVPVFHVISLVPSLLGFLSSCGKRSRLGNGADSK